MIRSLAPHDPSDVVVEVAAAGEAGVAAAVERARAAQRGWASGPVVARAAALNAAADAVAEAGDELAVLAVREVGKPITEARGEVARSVAILRYYAQQVFDPVGAIHEPSTSGLLFTRRRPRGVAGLITPWNFPLAIPLWKAAPALAYGNGVVLKPAPEATACALRLGELLAPHLPEGLFAVVPGDAVEGRTLIALADVVSFTGSTAVGGIVSRAAVDRGIPAQCEMGGQNASIVLPDADIARAAAQIAGAAMGYAGQKCTATKRVIAVGDAADAVQDALVSAVEALPFGDPADPATAVGPVISGEARDNVLAATAGGKVLTGGTAGIASYVAPTVMAELPSDHVLLTDEVFGPICAVVRAADVDEAVAIANGVRYGLVSAVYTRDLAAALEVSGRLDTGMVKVNSPTAGVDFYLPFGGEKASSQGSREQGKAAQELYTSLHTITIAP